MLLTTCCSHRSAPAVLRTAGASLPPPKGSAVCVLAMDGSMSVRIRPPPQQSIANCIAGRVREAVPAMRPLFGRKDHSVGWRAVRSHTFAVVLYRVDSDLRSHILLDDNSLGISQYSKSRLNIATERSVERAIDVLPARDGDRNARNDRFH
jgi:hypothetical protein